MNLVICFSFQISNIWYLKCRASVADSQTVLEIEGAFGKKENKETHLQRDVTYDRIVNISRFTNTITKPPTTTRGFRKTGGKTAKRNSNLLKISFICVKSPSLEEN